MDGAEHRVVDPTLRALARARLWGCLSDTFGRGLGPDTLAAWRAVGVLPDEPIDLDAYAAAHTRLFLIEVSPHESVFLSAGSLLGGEVTAGVRADRAASGLGDPAEVEPDHLAAECAWLAFLNGAEADARRDGVDPTRILHLQGEMLDRHLLRWLPALAQALRGVDGDPTTRFYVDLVDTALTAARDQHVALGVVPVAWELPPVREVLDDPDTGLRRIAAHLCRPALAGGWWSRSALVAHGRRLELPAGFGSRVDLLEGLFLSAAQYGRVPELCDALIGDLEGWAAAADGPWGPRLTHTVAVLHRVALEAGSGTVLA